MRSLGYKGYSGGAEGAFKEYQTQGIDMGSEIRAREVGSFNAGSEFFQHIAITKCPDISKNPCPDIP